MVNNLNEYKNWLIRRNLSLNTIGIYTRTVRDYGNKELNTDNIVGFVREKLTKYEPASLQSFRYSLSSYAKFKKIEIEWEIINKLIPIVQQKFFTTISKTELEQLKQVKTRAKLITNQRNDLILDFLFYTGIRVGELVNIKHCDYQDKSLRIHGKGNKIRFIPIPEFLVKYFNFHSNSYLFTTKNGCKLKETQVWKIVNLRSEKAQINKKITPHSFRRSFATLLNGEKCRLTTIQKILGHSDINTTSNYIHNSFEEIYQDYSKLWISSPPPLFINQLF